MNYEGIALMAADLSKQMIKLNNQLDKLIDKQNLLNDPAERKQEALALLEQEQWEAVAQLCAEQAKEEQKREKLAEEEQAIRDALEQLRQQLLATAEGNLPAASEANESED